MTELDSFKSVARRCKLTPWQFWHNIIKVRSPEITPAECSGGDIKLEKYLERLDTEAR